VNTIIIPDVTDAGKVAAALQMAADAVLNATSLKDLGEGTGYNYGYQYIHRMSTLPAVACVGMTVGGLRELQDMTTLTVSIMLPGGYHKEAREHYVPRSVIGRLRVRLDGGSHRAQGFVLDSANYEAKVVVHLPTRTFERCPKAIITTV